MCLTKSHMYLKSVGVQRSRGQGQSKAHFAIRVVLIVFIISLFLKLTVHSTYTEKLQINEQIKLYTIYTNTDGISREDKLSYLYI